MAKKDEKNPVRPEDFNRSGGDTGERSGKNPSTTNNEPFEEGAGETDRERQNPTNQQQKNQQPGEKQKGQQFEGQDEDRDSPSFEKQDKQQGKQQPGQQQQGRKQQNEIGGGEDETEIQGEDEDEAPTMKGE